MLPLFSTSLPIVFSIEPVMSGAVNCSPPGIALPIYFAVSVTVVPTASVIVPKVSFAAVPTVLPGILANLTAPLKTL